MTAALADAVAGTIVRRWPAVRWFAAIGTLCIIAGGLVAAVTSPLDLGDGAWLAAYLVLVGGVAQIGLGAGQALLTAEAVPQRLVAIEVIGWNAALACTIIGTLASTPLVTTIGAVATVLSLVCFIGAVRGSQRGIGWARVLYQLVLIVVLVSTPVGVVLAWTRHS